MQTTPIDLLRQAVDASKNAYAPYSEFHVGAALETEDGTIFTGCNVENASYGLTICAERNAIFAAVAAGYKKITQIAIIAQAEQVPYPCGACRQVIAEFADPDCLVYIAPAKKIDAFEAIRLGDLLPKTFHLNS